MKNYVSKTFNPPKEDKLMFFAVKNTGFQMLKEIPGTDGQYFVSDTGQIISLSNREPRVLKPYLCGNGYLYVNIYGQNKRVHRLVAQAFIPNPENLPVVHHIDGNKLNNNRKNLTWTTQQQNVILYHESQKATSEDE